MALLVSWFGTRFGFNVLAIPLDCRFLFFIFLLYTDAELQLFLSTNIVHVQLPCIYACTCRQVYGMHGVLPGALYATGSAGGGGGGVGWAERWNGAGGITHTARVMPL